MLLLPTEGTPQAATYIGGLDNYARDAGKNMRASNSVHIPSIGQQTTGARGIGSMNEKSQISSKPVIATDKDIRRAMAITDLLVQPLGVLPVAVGDPIRPVAIGFFQQVSPFLSPGVSVTALRRAIGAYVHSKRYYLACSRPDAMRHDIHGEPIEPVSDADKLNAQQCLQSFREQKSQTPAPAIVPSTVSAAENKRDLIRASLLGRPRS